MTTQQLDAEAACVLAPPRCPNCGKTVLIETIENLADLAVQQERRLMKHVLDAHEQDQVSLANQIHEGLASRMIAALLRLQAVGRSQQGDDPERAVNELGAVRKLLNDSIDEARRIASRLQPPSLTEFGIVAAINYLTAEIARDAELEIEFSHDGESAWAEPALEIAVFRIVQELLTNACRHSQTRKVQVDLARADGHVQVEVRDWGIGFDPTKLGGDGFGLDEVRERARLLGGRAIVASAPDGGTRVMVELPLTDEASVALE